MIRPLLGVTRAQIEEYLRERGQDWCTDATNGSGDYTRNRIRNELLPWIEREINAGAREHLINLGKRAAEAQELIGTQAQAWLEQNVRRTGEYAELPLPAFSALPDPVQKRVLQLCVRDLAGHLRDVTARQLDAAAVLPGKQVGYETLRIGYREGPQTVRFSTKSRFFALPEGLEPPRNPYTKWFDYDKIKRTFQWRTRQPGDVIAIAGGRKKTLARFMIDEKIPAALRESIPVLADGGDVVWVAGYRISEAYKITAETARVVQVTFRPEA